MGRWLMIDRPPAPTTVVPSPQPGPAPAGSRPPAKPSPPRRPGLPAPRGLWLGVPVLLAVLSAAMLLRHGRHPLDSDSVAQQSMLNTWSRLGHGETYVPEDTWILKFPVYAVVEAFPLPSATRVLVETTILNGTGYALVAWACWLIAGGCGFERRWTDVVLPLTWLTTLSGALGGYLSIMPNHRNIELGMAFALLALLGRYLSTSRPDTKDGRPRVWRFAGGLAAWLTMALLWLDDPYFVYLLAVPAVLGCVAWFAVRRCGTRCLVAAGLIISSVLALPLGRGALALVGVHTSNHSNGVSLEPAAVWRRIGLLPESLAHQFGWTEAGTGAGTAHGAAVVVLLAGMVAGGYLALRAWRLRSLPLFLISSHWLLVVGAVIINRAVVDYHAGRYLMPGLLDLAVGLGLAAASLRRRRPRIARAVTVLLAFATSANLVFAVVSPRPAPVATGQRHTILAAIDRSGASKGFGNFWSTNVYVHASRGRLAISDVTCEGGRLQLRHWLTDTARAQAPARRSFLIWEAGYFSACPLSALDRQLGVPRERTPIPSPTTSQPAYLLVYDHDIGPLLDGAPLPENG